MGIIDRAKNSLSKNFGDETVRVVDYDDDRESMPPVEVPRPPKVTKAPRPKKERPVKERPAPVEEEDNEEEVKDSWSFGRKKKQEEDASPFALEGDEGEAFYASRTEAYQAHMAERFGDTPDLTPRGAAVEDVLEVLQIPATFEIEKNIFLPDDLEDTTFDLQAPYGFEQGQVTAFLERVKVTVARYVELLRLRNEHVAQLASVVDRLQVDNNNLRYQTEMAAGINIMPTQDSDDLENKYMEAKLKIKRLEEALRTQEQGDALTSAERDKYEELQNQFSLLVREKELADEELFDLKNRLAYLEQEYDFDAEEEAQEEEVALPGDDYLELPEVEDLPPASPSIPAVKNSAFSLSEEDDPFQASSVDLLGDGLTTQDGSYYTTQDDDEDPLDRLMNEWNK